MATKPAAGTVHKPMTALSVKKADSVVVVPFGRQAVKLHRIGARRDVKLAKHQTKQIVAAGRTQKAANRTQEALKRTEASTNVKLAKEQTTQKRADKQTEEAWALADLQRAKAERKQAEASKLTATAANTRLLLQIGAGAMVVFGLLGLYLKLK